MVRIHVPEIKKRPLNRSFFCWGYSSLDSGFSPTRIAVGNARLVLLKSILPRTALVFRLRCKRIHVPEIKKRPLNRSFFCWGYSSLDSGFSPTRIAVGNARLVLLKSILPRTALVFRLRCKRIHVPEIKKRPLTRSFFCWVYSSLDSGFSPTRIAVGNARLVLLKSILPRTALVFRLRCKRIHVPEIKKRPLTRSF